MIPRFVPPRRVLRIAGWMAFWPVAFVASQGSLLTIAFLVGAFVPVVVTKRWAALFGGVAVLTAVASIERTFLPGFVGLAIGAAAGLTYDWLMRRARQREGEPLDGALLVLEPFALFVAMAAVFVAHGAQAAHLHATFPSVAQLLVGIALLAATSSVAAWRSLRDSLDDIYSGAHRHLCVRHITDDVPAPLVSEVSLADAAIVEGGAHGGGPYRAGEGRVIARVPAGPAPLQRRHVRFFARAVGTALLCLGSTALVLPRLTKVAHRADFASSSMTLPPLPGSCRGRPVKLRFVALAPLRVLDIEEIASRYRATGIAEVVVERPLEVEERWIDRGRGQIAGEDIARAARKRYGAHPNELLVVVTDRDMFLREVEWRFAFATREAGVAVVSIARMDPLFPLFAPSTYDPAPSECRAVPRARAFRMITRQILLGVCSAETLDDPRSARRRSVMGLSDLDAIDEATY